MINSYLEYKEIQAHYGESFATVNYGLVEMFNRTCPYCGSVLERKYFFQRNDKHFKSGEYIDQHESIYYCPNDGWWQHKIYERQDEAPKNWYSIIHEGILKTYDLDSSATPTEVLNDYIYHHPEKIVTMHHKKMEELVASVFSDFYHCEAKVVGKSSDGGIDIVLINSDNPTMIQVKRRKNLEHTKSVSGIRELLGATLLNRSKSCMFVSTAKHFSKKAQETASLAIELGHVQQFDLIDYEQFISMLQSRPKNVQNIWDELLVLEKLTGNHYGIAYA